MAEPVHVVELLPGTENVFAPEPSGSPARSRAEMTPLPSFVSAPKVEAPISDVAVSTPPTQRQAQDRAPPTPQPAPVQPRTSPTVATASVSTMPKTANRQGGDSPQAKKKAARYYSLLMAHLNRKKRYPAEAKKARQQGVVTVRFTVERSGAVSASSIKRSSGSSLLDHATLDLMQRVSPLPPIPSAMERERLTISLPIDYSLNSK